MQIAGQEKRSVFNEVAASETNFDEVMYGVLVNIGSLFGRINLNLFLHYLSSFSSI